MAVFRALLPWAVLAAALALNAATLVPWLARDGSDFDAVHLYLPYAEELLKRGLAFFADERSLQAPPFSYTWPALVGPGLERVKVVNLALSGVTVLLLFRLGWLLHSRAAGLIAALLFAASPLLRPFLATALTEPPFILLSVTWAWALAEWLSGGRAVFAIVAGAAFALAALTRGSLFYFAPVMVAFFAFAALRTRGPDRRMALGAAAAHVLALALVGIFIARAIVYFDFPFFASGAGNALYLGVSPLTGGYDSNYLGIAYDVGAVVQQPSHLTLSSERLLKGVGMMVLAEQSTLQVAEAFARKALAFVFVTNAEPDVQLLRACRVALVVLSVFGVLAIRELNMRLVIGALLVYQVAVHVPALYTHRYSVATLDPWLVLTAGVALAALWERRLAGGIVATLVAAAIAIGWWLALSPVPEPDVYKAARLTVWEDKPRSIAVDRGTVVDIEVRDAPRFHAWRNHVVVIDAALRGPGAERCGPLRVAYRRSGEAAFSAEISRQLALDGKTARHQLGGRPMGLHAEGTLRLAMSCPTGASLELAKLAIVQPMGALDARERYLGEKPRFAYERGAIEAPRP